MEIEEGVNVTEQVVALLDQMIRQGKELRFWENETTDEKCTEDEFIGYGKNVIKTVYHRIYMPPSLECFFQEQKQYLRKGVNQS